MNATSRVLRYEVPVNDRVHTIGDGRVVLVTQKRNAPATASVGLIEVWVEQQLPDGWPEVDNTAWQQVQVFGTGHPIPDEACWLGSCLDGALVWHLYRVAPADLADQPATQVITTYSGWLPS